MDERGERQVLRKICRIKYINNLFQKIILELDNLIKKSKSSL